MNRRIFLAASAVAASSLTVTALVAGTASATTTPVDTGTPADTGTPPDTGPATAAPAASAPAGTEPVVAEAPPLPANTELIAGGLDNPRGIFVDTDGVVWIPEAGAAPPADLDPAACTPGPEGADVCWNDTGALSRVGTDGTLEPVIEGLRSIGEQGSGLNATGPHSITVGADGTVYLLFGLGADPAVRAQFETDGLEQAGRLFSVDLETGALTEVADIAGFETSDNPDGGLLDSNPFGVAATADGVVVSDAGGNDLLSVDGAGAIATLAVFPDRDSTVGAPMNPVPTGVAVADDGSFYVGELTGFPFPVGGAQLLHVPAGGGDPMVRADGFTNVIDVALGADGAIYVLQFANGGILGIDPADPATFAGDLIRVAADGTKETVVTGLTSPTSVAVGADGTVYVTNVGVVPGAGQLLRVTAP